MPDVEQRYRAAAGSSARLALIVLAIGLLTVWTSDALAQPGVEDGLIDEELDGGGGLSFPVLGSHLSARAADAASGRLAGSAATPHDSDDRSVDHLRRRY